MASRPIFIPDPEVFPYVRTVDVEFQWFSGFSIVQARKSIVSMHEASEKMGLFPILEISRKSESKLGVSLSAFELLLRTPEDRTMSVECAYQGSKVFEDDGPFHELYDVSSRAAKTDSRLRNSGKVKAFNFLGREFPIEPPTAFYDWLYMTALSQLNAFSLQKLKPYMGFSDIVFNPKVSINCQARAAALYVSLNHAIPNFADLLKNWDSYMDAVMCENELSLAPRTAGQLRLPFEDASNATS